MKRPGFEPRTTVALAAVPSGTGGNATLYAVADDGTMWQLNTGMPREGWSPVQPLPMRTVKRED